MFVLSCHGMVVHTLDFHSKGREFEYYHVKAFIHVCLSILRCRWVSDMPERYIFGRSAMTGVMSERRIPIMR